MNDRKDYLPRNFEPLSLHRPQPVEVTTAQKFDTDKVPLQLLSTVALEKIGEVLAFGAKKYAAHNWRKGAEWTRFLGAALRHITAYNDGQDTDPETGLSHLAHAGCCIMFLLEYEDKGLGTDDRYKEPTQCPQKQPSAPKSENLSTLATPPKGPSHHSTPPSGWSPPTYSPDFPIGLSCETSQADGGES